MATPFTAKNLRRVGFVLKHHKTEAEALALELCQMILDRKLSVVFADESRSAAAKARKLGAAARVKVVPKAKLAESTDLILVLGGDGTFLSIARLMQKVSTPVLGVNLGQLGFLTEVKRSEILNTLEDILAHRPHAIQERALLEVCVCRGGKIVHQGPVVNDAVISKGAIARIIGMEVSVNGKFAYQVRADGLIVSSPTGSTAYSLAAGGPLIEPSLPALVLSPICPHSLTQRPLVISDDSTVEISLKDRPGHVFLTLDGQDAVDLREGDCVQVKRFRKHKLKLISSSSRDYFGLLREKLKFGMRD